MNVAEEARVIRALQPSRRMLVKLDATRWGVLTGRDRRRRPLAVATGEMVGRLAAAGRLAPMGDDAFVLADGEAPQGARPPVSRWVFVAAGARRPGVRGKGAGFVGMALQAGKGCGVITLRQAEAGLRLVADAERAAADHRLTMDWDAGPATRQRRGGSDGGRAGDALRASRTLARLRVALGEPTWRLLWALCVDGETLRAIGKRLALAQEDVKSRTRLALQALANAYES